MPRTADAHLARAREYLAIAESDDSKRQAYIKAAEEIAAAKESDQKLTNVEVATSIGKSDKYVHALLKWRETSYEADTPFLMDTGATGRAAISHTRATLRDPEATTKALEGLTDEQVDEVSSRLFNERMKRINEAAGIELKTHEQIMGEQAQRLINDPLRVLSRFGASLGRASGAVRVSLLSYQELLALVEREDIREEAREDLIEWLAGVNLAIQEAIDGSFEAALERVLTNEKE
jgi:hypothetical protein